MHPYPAGIAAHHVETTIESLAPDVTLRSPLTAYRFRGRDDVAAVLSGLGPRPARRRSRTRAALAHVSTRPFAAIAPLYEGMAERLVTR